ncbi:hypothetical protein K1T71_008928 [Dendrolimus kikuchii]|uniref:Uncharacterized protein n=1 Tax=Dendrolimus kikuchii TaxID=765133 RepID=A0ACC1CVM0_9NEOP|nr:hypothetical protein K1T71_008928 [Dendrolimus kikuchii]
MSIRFAQTNKETRSCDSERFADSLRTSEAAALVSEYVSRASRLAPLFPRLRAGGVRSRPLPHDMRLAYETPQNLALELSKSILYENADSIDLKSIGSLDAADDSLWNGKPQHYFESMNYGETAPSDDTAVDADDYESDSLAP